MKSKILLLVSLFFMRNLSAQFVISSTAELYAIGGIQLTVHNTDLQNNGTFSTGTSRVTISGDNISSINGNGPMQFFELEVNKENFASILLEREIGVRERLLFTSGFLLLNGFNVDLGTTGHLDGENERSRVYGPTGGEVLFNVNLNSPTNSNPANLGVFITSDKDLGNVTIRRGHQSQVNNTGTGNSILRYYDIIPANNTNLNATLRFRYFDEELNGLGENTLEFFQSDNNGINWFALGFNLRDGALNFVEKAGINSFSRFSLFSPGTVLPVRFALLNTRCEGNRVVITWKTLFEQNSSHFNVERSVDGINWSVINNVAAAGNSNVEKSYSVADNNPLSNAFYRIAQYDLDGRVEYTNAIRSSCDIPGLFSVWPNPTLGQLFVNIPAAQDSPVQIRLFDSKGALVKIQKSSVLQGNNRVTVDMQGLASGVYQLSVDWNSGQSRKTIQVMKL